MCNRFFVCVRDWGTEAEKQREFQMRKFYVEQAASMSNIFSMLQRCTVDYSWHLVTHVWNKQLDKSILKAKDKSTIAAASVHRQFNERDAKYSMQYTQQYWQYRNIKGGQFLNLYWYINTATFSSIALILARLTAQKNISWMHGKPNLLRSKPFPCLFYTSWHNICLFLLNHPATLCYLMIKKQPQVNAW